MSGHTGPPFLPSDGSSPQSIPNSTESQSNREGDGEPLEQVETPILESVGLPAESAGDPDSRHAKRKRAAEPATPEPSDSLKRPKNHDDAEPSSAVPLQLVDMLSESMKALADTAKSVERMIAALPAALPSAQAARSPTSKSTTPPSAFATPTSPRTPSAGRLVGERSSSPMAPVVVASLVPRFHGGSISLEAGKDKTKQMFSIFHPLVSDGATLFRLHYSKPTTNALPSFIVEPLPSHSVSIANSPPIREPTSLPAGSLIDVERPDGQKYSFSFKAGVAQTPTRVPRFPQFDSSIRATRAQNPTPGAAVRPVLRGVGETDPDASAVSSKSKQEIITAIANGEIKGILALKVLEVLGKPPAASSAPPSPLVSVTQHTSGWNDEPMDVIPPIDEVLSAPGQFLSTSPNPLRLPPISPSRLNTSPVVITPDEEPIRSLEAPALPVASEKPDTKLEMKSYFERSIKAPTDTATTFEKFPYHLEQTLRDLLISSVFLYLEKPELVKVVADMHAMSRCIALSGPPGTERYQQTLVECLAAHFKARLLIVDPNSVTIEDAFKAASQVSAEATEEAAEIELPGDLSSTSSSRVPLKVGDRVKYVGGMTSSTNPLAAVEARLKSISQLAPGVISITRADRHRGPAPGSQGRVVLVVPDGKYGVRFDKPFSGGSSLGSLCEDRHGFFVELGDLRAEQETAIGPDVATIEALFEVATMTPDQPIIVFIKSADKFVTSSYTRYHAVKTELEKIKTGRIVVIASRVSIENHRHTRSGGSIIRGGGGAAQSLLELGLFDLGGFDGPRGGRASESSSESKLVLSNLFPCKIRIQPPEDPTKVASWEKKIDRDAKRLKSDTNVAQISRALAKCGAECPNMDPTPLNKKVLSTSRAERIAGLAIAEHLRLCHTNGTEASHSASGQLIISAESITSAIGLVGVFKSEKPKGPQDLETDNPFEKALQSDMIPASQIGVKFDDIGALDDVKQTLRELVLLPLQRPELFRRGNLAKPCKGILLFGPPGTGKSMLAKAIATESGASFINISMASIGSKWFGEAEKYSRAVFTLAAKVAPCVIFIDEVDAMLGRRDKNGEHEAMRKVKNEFMAMWDGLKSSESERVLVLAATNRPFDLDDAVLRRMPRRILIDLPDAANRKKILKLLLKNEELGSDFNIDQLAADTDGFTGSDLKHLCIAAAYQPIREFLDNEKLDSEQPNTNASEPAPAPAPAPTPVPVPIPDSPTHVMDVDDEHAESRHSISLRALKMEDFRKALKQVSPSVSEDATSIAELRKWNQLYGEGGNRTKQPLTYFM